MYIVLGIIKNLICMWLKVYRRMCVDAILYKGHEQVLASHWATEGWLWLFLTLGPETSPYPSRSYAIGVSKYIL